MAPATVGSGAGGRPGLAVFAGQQPRPGRRLRLGRFEQRRCGRPPVPFHPPRAAMLTPMTRPTPDLLDRTLDRIVGTRVLVVGDLMLDRWIDGTVARISPEAPIPILKVERESEMAGGAGNVAANLMALGAVPVLIGLIGDDDPGRRLLGLLTREAAEIYPLTDADRPTTVKTRYVAGTQQMLRSDREDARPLDPALLPDALATIDRVLGTVGAVILSDYGKGMLTDALIAAVVERAQAKGLPLVVDPKGRDYRRYRGASLITPNRRELAEGTALPTGDDADVEAACRHLIASCGIAGVLATRSEQGMTLVEGDAPAQHFRAAARAVFDVSGAGDTVVAVIAAALAVGAPAAAAAVLANAAGGIVVAKAGTATATGDEIRGAVGLAEAAHPSAPILRFPTDGARIDALIAGWRSAGAAVSFTNGCFDILHPGHVSLIRQARATGDRLVIGLNTDASVRGLKGPDRPINDEVARAAVLSALADVDAVILFGEQTPFDLIRRLLPDTLVKGADYPTKEAVVGWDVVEAAGGRVVLADLVPGQSTTATVDRLRGG